MKMDPLKLDTVRRNTMRRIVSLTVKQAFLQSLITKLSTQSGSPIDSVFKSIVTRDFEDYRVELSTQMFDMVEGHHHTLYFYGGNVSSKEQLMLIIPIEPQTPESKRFVFSFPKFMEKLAAHNISVTNFEHQIDLSEAKLNQASVLVSKYNNAAKRYNEMMDDLEGLVIA